MSGDTITELYAFVALDNEDGNEGIIAFMGPDGIMLPMIGADTARVNSLIPIADATGVKYEIRYFKLSEQQHD